MIGRFALLAIGLLGFATWAVAPDKEDSRPVFVVAGFGGGFEDFMREDVFPEFERQHNVRLVYVAGNSTNTLARLYAQRRNQEIDVAIMDDGPAYKAIALGLCGQIEQLPADLMPQALVPGNKAVGIGMLATGIMYNRTAFRARGWPEPTSWSDLANPRFKHLLVVPPLNNTYGLHALVEFARAHGGGEQKIDSGFRAFKALVDPNVLVYEPSPGKMTELFSNQQAIIGVWGSARVKMLADTGLDVQFVYPREGAYALLEVICPVASARSNPLAQSFVSLMLSKHIQERLSEIYGSAPVTTSAVVEDNEPAPLPMGERMASLRMVDWAIANRERDLWNKRWAREIER